MPKVRTTYAYKIQSIVKEFPDEFMQSIKNEVYCSLCNCAVSCNKHFLVDSHRNTSKHQKALGSRSEDLIPQTSQTFFRSSDTDFVEKVTKAFLSADIPLYKLYNTHIKNLFRDIDRRLPSETTCRRTALQLSEDELKRTRNAVYDKQIFFIVDESTVSGTQYLNILVGSLETPNVSYLYDCQPLNCAPISNIIDCSKLMMLLEILESTKASSAQSWTALFRAFSSHRQPSASLTKLFPSWTTLLAELDKA